MHVSNRVQGLIWDIPFPSPVAKTVALKLADYADDEGGSIFPATATIAERTGYARSAVCKWLFAMENCGLLRVVRRSKGGTRPRGQRYGNTSERAFDMALLQRLVPPKKGQAEVELQLDTIKRRSPKKTRKAKKGAWVEVPVLVIKASVHQEDTCGEVSATRTLSVRQEDTECPPGGHKPFRDPFEGIPSLPPYPPFAQLTGGERARSHSGDSR